LKLGKHLGGNWQNPLTLMTFCKSNQFSRRFNVITLNYFVEITWKQHGFNQVLPSGFNRLHNVLQNRKLVLNSVNIISNWFHCQTIQNIFSLSIQTTDQTMTLTSTVHFTFMSKNTARQFIRILNVETVVTFYNTFPV
jgi:hypothetical protein